MCIKEVAARGKGVGRLVKAIFGYENCEDGCKRLPDLESHSE